MGYVCAIEYHPLCFLLTPNRRRSEMMYTQSKYNLVFPIKDNRYIIYNTLKNSIVVADEEAITLIKENRINELPQEFLEMALNAGVLIPADLDELQFIRTQRKTSLYLSGSHPHIGLTLLMTYSCNLRCPYCYEGERKNLGGILTPEKIETILKFVLSHKTEKTPEFSVHVSFYGGEPLLNWHGCKYTLQRLDALNNEGNITKYFASFTTNGTLINREVIEYINNYNITSMQITLDGPKDIHDKKRISASGGGTFDKIIENMLLLKENVKKKTFYLNLRINIDKTNYQRIPELLDYLKDIGLSGINISFGIVRGNIPFSCNFHNTLFVGSDLSKVLPMLWEAATERGFKVQTRPNIRHIYCMYEKLHSYLIDPNLNVYPCWEMAGIEKYRIGKILDNGKFKANPFYYTAKGRDPTVFKECRDCVFLPICMGGCAMESIRRNGDPNGPGCDISRYIWKQGLEFYLKRKYPQLFKNGSLSSTIMLDFKIPKRRNNNAQG